jgi:AhpC/TSA family protein
MATVSPVAFPTKEALAMRLIRALGLAGLLGLALPGFADEGKAEVGKPAPDFDLPATNIAKAFPDAKGKKTIALKDFQGANGKNVVLFFFPKAMTAG